MANRVVQGVTPFLSGRLLYLHKSQVLLLLIKRNDQTCFLDKKQTSLGIKSKSEWIYSERLPIGHWLMPSEVLLFFNACMQTAGCAAGRDAGCQENLWKVCLNKNDLYFFKTFFSSP